MAILWKHLNFIEVLNILNTLYQSETAALASIDGNNIKLPETKG